jgi:hypothetical protein
MAASKQQKPKTTNLEDQKEKITICFQNRTPV